MGVVNQMSRRFLPFGIPLRSDFPPAHMVEKPVGFSVEELEQRTKRLQRLENLYHKGQDAAWDGKKVLADLVKEHGPVHVDPEKRDAIRNVFGLILWGELAAWETASYLAEHIRDNTEAKMAATLQTFDEARHFYVLRDYLRLLGIEEMPPVNSFVKTILSQILETDSVVEKLIGMQLFVEHIAVHLFKHIAEINVEPVLSHLLPYFQRDESRHVALGKLHLPELLRELSPKETARLYLYQLWLMGFMSMSIEYHQKDADVLGLDTRKAMMRALRDQTEMIESMGSYSNRKGTLLLPKRLRFLNRYMLRNVYAAQGEDQALAFKLTRPYVRRFAVSAEKVWGAIA